MIVGEAPGEVEERDGAPFVGPAGRVLDGMLKEVGIDREKCYITNVMMTRPLLNNYDSFTEIEQEAGHKRLAQEVEAIKPNVIVALGDTAMQALTRVKGISNWRGSILQGKLGSKVVPTFHPAAIMREWKFRAAAVADLAKALEQSKFTGIKQTERTLYIAKRFDDALEQIHSLKGAPYVAFDIETATNEAREDISCISFAPSNRPNWSVCIPFFFKWGEKMWNQEEEIALWDAIREILTDDGIGKIAHNGSYDIEFIERVAGFRVCPFYFDTMLGAHALYLELPKSLAFWVSILTDHPFYKYQLKTQNSDEFFFYNATDSCLTMEIAEKLIKQLKEDKLWDFYIEYIHALWEPLMEMQIVGVKFDFLKRNSVKKRVQEEMAVLQKRLDGMVGHPLNINSPKQMKEWLYGELKLKVKTKRRKGDNVQTVSADEEALENLYSETGNEAIRIVLKLRERGKLLSTYLEVKLDEDKRIRCSYLITGTETGRLSSRATARGTGTNLQNVPPGVVRSLFIPDHGKVFINADLSQAEARVVAYLANEPRLIRVFEEGGDIHRKNAANIFKIEEGEVTDTQRQMAKRVVHASNYGMGPLTFAKTAGIEAKEAKRLLNQYFATYPGIANWHLDIRERLRRGRFLVSPFGRKRYFYNRWGESLTKEGLAFIPQSTVADIINQGLLKVWRSQEVEDMDLLLQVHDSLLLQVPADKVRESVAVLESCLKIPVKIGKKTLVIPVDIKTGNDWELLEKWKTPSEVPGESIVVKSD